MNTAPTPLEWWQYCDIARCLPDSFTPVELVARAARFGHHLDLDAVTEAHADHTRRVATASRTTYALDPVKGTVRRIG